MAYDEGLQDGAVHIGRNEYRPRGVLLTVQADREALDPHQAIDKRDTRDAIDQDITHRISLRDACDLVICQAVPEAVRS
jgi:hypothetical protein